MSHDERECYEEALRRIDEARRLQAAQLDLSLLGLKVLPPEIALLSALTELRCTEAQVADLRPIANLTNLSALYLRGTQVADLTPLANLVNLSTLYLRGTLVADLTPLANLRNLTQLYCMETVVADLDSLAGLVKLSLLNCCFTHVASLAPLENLANLADLDCSHSRVSELAPIAKLLSARLNRLAVQGCPVRDVPSELLGGGPPETVAKALRAYFSELQAGAEPEREVRVVLLGNAQVGKTTLAHALVHQQTPPSPVVDRTHGIVTTTFELSLEGGREAATIRLWDFGGQDLYHAAHRLFLASNAIYLLLWTDRTDEPPEDPQHPVAYWQNLIRDLASDSPVLLVKNQIDRQDLHERPQLLDGFVVAQEVKISALRYTNMATLRAALGDQIIALRSRFSYDVPRSWTRLKQDLEARRVDKAIELAHFGQICAVHGVDDADVVLRYLHDTGFLFYREGTFGEKVILDQTWIIDVAYRLFDPKAGVRQRLLRQGGTFTGADTRDFWGDADEDERAIYMGFLLRSGIAFILGARDDAPFEAREFVLPALLPERLPLAASVWGDHQPQELCVEFRYQFLTRALIEQILARTARWSPERAFWREGILFQDPENGTQLLLQYRLDPTGVALIRVRARGQQPELAAMKVRHLLDELHPRVKPEEVASGDGKRFEKWLPSQENEHAHGGAAQISQTFPTAALTRRNLNVFISYAHEDEEHKDDLEIHLRALRRLVPFEFWSDRHILAGAEWEKEILERLAKADVVVMLLSPHFFASDYCYGVEMENALLAYRTGGGVPVPIIVRSCDWTEFPIAHYQALPSPAKPRAEWRDADAFWTNVREGLGRLLRERIRVRDSAPG